MLGRRFGYILGVPIDALVWDEALKKISLWADKRESRYVCICNVHSIVTASKDNLFKSVIRGADMATPDGAPIAWMLRRLGFIGQQRINGPDLMWRYCKLAALKGQPVYFYGSTENTLDLLQRRLLNSFPELKIAGFLSPPFRDLTDAEDAEIVEQINKSSAGVLFVSLGCPKQEKWMAEHRGRINVVMVGVGAAFDYHAGTVRRAPLWMQHSGLEWLYRLMVEPRRLWKRYLVTNTLFVLGVTRQLLFKRNKR